MLPGSRCASAMRAGSPPMRAVAFADGEARRGHDVELEGGDPADQRTAARLAALLVREDDDLERVRSAMPRSFRVSATSMAPAEPTWPS